MDDKVWAEWIRFCCNGARMEGRRVPLEGCRVCGAGESPGNFCTCTFWPCFPSAIAMKLPNVYTNKHNTIGALIMYGPHPNRNFPGIPSADPEFGKEFPKNGKMVIFCPKWQIFENPEGRFGNFEISGDSTHEKHRLRQQSQPPICEGWAAEVLGFHPRCRRQALDVLLPSTVSTWALYFNATLNTMSCMHFYFLSCVERISFSFGFEYDIISFRPEHIITCYVCVIQVTTNNNAFCSEGDSASTQCKQIYWSYMA